MPNVIIRGIKYTYDFKCPADPRQAIILVHGAGGHKGHMSHQVEQLGHKFLTIAVDLPGHGESDGQAARDIKIYSDFIFDFATHVLGSKFFLAGHSMGGAIALDFALHFRDQINGLIIIGSGAKLKVNPKILESYAREQHFTPLINYAYGKQTPQAVIDQAIREMEATATDVYYRDYLACDSFDCTGQVQQIDVPALVLGADQDKMTPVALSSALAQNIKPSTLKIVTASGHMMMMEQPDQVNSYISDFMEGHKTS